MDNLITIEQRVKVILENHPEARDDDMKLYFLMCRESLSKRKDHPALTFEYVLTHYQQLGCPRFESVRRTRQMVQAKYPFLGCSPVARRRRHRGQEDFKNYAIEKKEVS